MPLMRQYSKKSFISFPITCSIFLFLLYVDNKDPHFKHSSVEVKLNSILVSSSLASFLKLESLRIFIILSSLFKWLMVLSCIDLLFVNTLDFVAHYT
jgi:hypothetical protein